MTLSSFDEKRVITLLDAFAEGERLGSCNRRWQGSRKRAFRMRYWERSDAMLGAFSDNKMVGDFFLRAMRNQYWTAKLRTEQTRVRRNVRAAT